MMVYGVMKHKSIYRIIKSDRINALRKQYDAFVQEDKKRKERNEYILGRLDKIRYCTTLVPVRHKTLPSINQSPATYVGNQIIPDIPIPKIDDQYLISEISKNYILIPKLRSSFIPDYIQQPPNNTDIMKDIRKVQQLNPSNTPNVISNENNDWKNKYEILNILRNEEEGKQTTQLVSKDVPVSIINKNIPLDNTNLNAALCHNEIMPNTKADLEYKYLDDFPEKDTPIDKRNYELRGSYEAFDNTGTAINSVSNTVDDTIADINYKLQNTNLENNKYESSDPSVLSEDTNYAEHGYYAEPTVHQPLGEQTDYLEHTEPITNAEQIIGISPNEHISENSEKVELNIDIIQATNSSEVRKEINNDQTALDSESLDYIQYETENTKVQELQPNFGLQLKQVNETEQKIPTAETDLDVAAQQPRMEVISQFMDSAEQQHQFVNETQQFLDETEQQQLFVDETPQQQLFVVGAQQEQYFEGAQQQQYFEGAQQQQYADGAQQQYVDGAVQQYVDGAQQQQYVDGSQQQYTSNEETQQQPTGENIIENPSNVDNIASIEAFDAEQREMFYSDNQPQQYEYEQPDANVYDQGYPQNVSYREDQDYPNYENVDQTYNPVNLAENEEQTLRYDQAYQQQYVDPYEKAYEKNEEPSQVYEDIQQTEMEHIEQMQYQGYNKEQVETMLDSEEGITQEKDKTGTTETPPLPKTN